MLGQTASILMAISLTSVAEAQLSVGCQGGSYLDTDTQKCANCQFASYNPAYNGTSCTSCKASCTRNQFVSDFVDECQEPPSRCEGCLQQCSNPQDVLLWPCSTGMRAADPSRCIAKTHFSDIRSHRCAESGKYFDLQGTTAATRLKSELLSVSPSGVYFAVSHVDLDVKIYRSLNLDQPLLSSETTLIPEFQFDQPSPTSNVDVFKSLTWSLDGKTLYVSTRNASIMRISVSDEGKFTVAMSWSKAPSTSSMEIPCSHIFSNSSCVAMPTIQSAAKQIVLICSFDTCSGNDRSSYLVRILSNGDRLPVPLLHRALYPSTRLMYDVSWNVAYWSTYSEWPFNRMQNHQGPWANSTTKRNVLKVMLSTDFNIDKIGDLFPVNLFPASFSKTFEAASIMPGAGGLLFAYMANRSDMAELFVFKTQNFSMPLDTAKPLHEYFYVNGSLRTLATSSYDLPSRVFFTEHGRFFVNNPKDPDTILTFGMCKCQFFSFLHCPDHETSTNLFPKMQHVLLERSHWGHPILVCTGSQNASVQKAASGWTCNQQSFHAEMSILVCQMNT